MTTFTIPSDPTEAGPDTRTAECEPQTWDMWASRAEDAISEATGWRGNRDDGRDQRLYQMRQLEDAIAYLEAAKARLRMDAQVHGETL